MGLTSGSFLVVIVCAAAGWIAGTAAVWPRLAGHQGSRAGGHPAASLAARLTGRAGLLVGSQLLVLLAFLVWLNSYFSFYGSWSALLRTAAPPAAHSARLVQPPHPVIPGGTHPVRVRETPPTTRNVTHRPQRSVLFYGFGLGPGHGQPGLPPRAAGPGIRHLVILRGAARSGMLARVRITGLRTGLVANSGYVYLPPQYFQRRYAQAKFPAVLALTGYPGGARSIVDRLGLPLTAARLSAAGRARPVVYVMLNVSPVFPRDTECTNVPAGPQVETFFAVDVPLAVEQAFRVTSSRAGWGVLGYSTGGYCAAKLAMMDPDTFSAAVALAGYYVALHDWTTGNIYGSSDPYRDENNLDWRLRHLPAPPVSVLVTSSKIGESTYPGTVRFLHLIRPPMHGYSFIIPVGGHNFGVWSRELPSTLEWLTRRLGNPGFASIPPPSARTRPAGSTT